MGAVATQLACGLLILGTGIAGNLVCRRIENRDAAACGTPSPAPAD